MLHRKRNIFFFLALAVVAIATSIQISLANLNQDLGYTQPIKAVDYYQTTEGWYITVLNINAGLEKEQLAKIKETVTATIHNLPMEEMQQYQEIAVTKITTLWQQAVNSDPLETVRCLADDIINDKVDSK